MARRLAAVADGQRRDGAYVRVSAVMGRGGDDFLSPTVQLDTIKAASATDGGRLVEVWEDIDVSGRSMQRPGLEQALQAARDKRIDRLYVYDLSRWSRNAAEGMTELLTFQRIGVEVVSATERVDRSTTSGRLTGGMLLLLAEHHSDLIGDRWRGVNQANAERGVLHGKTPLGYVKTARRVVEPDPALAPVVTEAFRRYADGSASIRALALDVAKIRGRAFTPYNMRALLRSPVYLGQVRLNGRLYPGTHPPLTDPETWDRVQARLAANAARPSRSLEAAHPLAGLARCAHCGWSLWRQTRSGRPRLRPYYACRGRKDDGSSTCAGIGTPRVDEVVAVVLGAVRAWLVDVPDTTAAEAARLAQQARAGADVTVLADEIGRLEKALGTLAVKLGTGVLSDVAYQAASAQMEASLAGLRLRLAEAAEVVTAPTFQASRDLAAALLELWPSMTPQEQNAALRSHVAEVLVRRAERPGEPMEERVEVVLR